MDLNEQTAILEEIKEFLFHKLTGKTFRIVIAVSDQNGEGFSCSVGNLSDRSSFHAWRLIVSGVTEESEELVKYFNLPLNSKNKKPIEPK